MADEPESLITEEVELPPGPPGSRFRREFEYLREKNRQGRENRPESKRPELRPADERGNYYVWNNNLNATRGPFNLLAQEAALEVLKIWRKELLEGERIEAHFRNQYRKTAAHRRLERRVETSRKKGRGKYPEDLKDYSPTPKPAPKTERQDTGWWGDSFSVKPIPPSENEIAEHWERERQAIRRHRTKKANRAKQGKATKAAAAVNRQTRSARKEKARATWRELKAQGMPERERRQVLCAELGISARTLRNYLNR